MASLETCKKCSETTFYLRKKGEHQVGKYCQKCDAWSKWVSKKDLQVLQRNGVKVHPETYVNINGESVGNYLGKAPTDIGITDMEQPAEYTFRGNTVPAYKEEIEVDEIDFGEDYDEEETNTPSTGSGLVKGETFQMKAETEEKPCPVCSVGVVELHSQKDEVKMHLVGNSLIVYDNTLSKMLASTTLKFCFHCGKAMK